MRRLLNKDFVQGVVEVGAARNLEDIPSNHVNCHGHHEVIKSFRVVRFHSSSTKKIPAIVDAMAGGIENPDP